MDQAPFDEGRVGGMKAGAATLTNDRDDLCGHGDLYGRDDPTTRRDRLPGDGDRVPSRSAIRERQQV